MAADRGDRSTSPPGCLTHGEITNTHRIGSLVDNRVRLYILEKRKNLLLLPGIECQIVLHTCEAGILSLLYAVYVIMTDFINFDLSPIKQNNNIAMNN